MDDSTKIVLAFFLMMAIGVCAVAWVEVEEARARRSCESSVLDRGGSGDEE